MGRWSYSSRWTTEECKSITTKFLNKHHYFNDGVRWGGISWSQRSEKTGSVNFDVSTLEGNGRPPFRLDRCVNKWLFDVVILAELKPNHARSSPGYGLNISIHVAGALRGEKPYC